MVKGLTAIMKPNLLIDLHESKRKGPGRRAWNLLNGLIKLKKEFDICSNNFDYAFGLQLSKVNLYFNKLNLNTPIGPNVIHEFSANKNISDKFKNFVVQSKWVQDFMTWSDESIANTKRFFEYPASVNIDEWYYGTKNHINNNCVFYTKYQSDENRLIYEKELKKRNQSYITIEYGKYNKVDLLQACWHSEYCVFNSCCEKSSNALLEILATNTPVYVIDSKRWIGDDKFDRATSAPHFSPVCGAKNSDNIDFNTFIENVKTNKYNPIDFVIDYDIDKIAQKVLDILEECYS